MTLEETVQWVKAVSASNMYGKGASWGVYTDSEFDAYVIATILRNYPEPIYHIGKGSQFSHYHVGDFVLFGKYKHFHVWYGGLQ